MSYSVLVIDDEERLNKIMSQKLKKEGFAVHQALSGQEGIDAVKREKIDAVILDYMLPDMTGIEVLEKIKEENEQIAIIMLTAYGNVENAVTAMKLGAYDFMNKPIELNILKEVVLKACANKQLQLENQMLKEELKRTGGNDDLVYKSDKMNEIIQFLEKIIESDANILILGESGVGKTALAKWIHQRSSRKDRPFVSLNCAAIPEQLLESELFGVRKGAFTGANESRPGKFELADGGTIFLDEIGETSMSMQAKLLHVIEEKKFMKLGSSEYRSVDVRIITATNRDLKRLVMEKKFREDLYYRLNLAEIQVPPLRERKEDISPIVYGYLHKLNSKYSKTISIASEALEKLTEYEWPGNIRELLNSLERIHLLKAAGEIKLHDLPHPIAVGDLVLSGSPAPLEP
ncbi:sigma-54 dependent transcriptional regulator [Ammoniphilus sp. YIM 78166]|uniref:sigma-54-dependent transcriptional regulator n=1 Tax=Ammoniphilus sp. YIM 78166 TaxID=1644106 RepID=UPI00106F43EC|nr:sigma-54 dependent transcriptional regulator [Ammoniphilus sp. YIM 78166]